MGAATPLLVILGQRGWEAELALAMIDRDTAIGAHIVELGTACDAELASLIGGARALLMPSFAEGFGLPVIEALQSGTPVIASDLPVFREIAGPIPCYLDPGDGPGWLAMIQAFCQDGPERTRQVSAMSAYRAPVWPDHFAAVETWLAALAIIPETHREGRTFALRIGFRRWRAWNLAPILRAWSLCEGSARVVFVPRLPGGAGAVPGTG